MPKVKTTRFEPNRLRAAIEARSLTRAEAAAAAGVSASLLSEAVRGRAIGMLSAQSIARVVRVPLAKLLAQVPEAAVA